MDSKGANMRPIVGPTGEGEPVSATQAAAAAISSAFEKVLVDLRRGTAAGRTEPRHERHAVVKPRPREDDDPHRGFRRLCFERRADAHTSYGIDAHLSDPAHLRKELIEELADSWNYLQFMREINAAIARADDDAGLAKLQDDVAALARRVEGLA